MGFGAAFGHCWNVAAYLRLFKAVAALVTPPDLLSWHGLCALPVLCGWLFLKMLNSGDKFVSPGQGNSSKYLNFPVPCCLSAPPYFLLLCSLQHQVQFWYLWVFHVFALTGPRC